MATTPEGKIKKKVKTILDKYQSSLYVYMPVPSGFGEPSLDFLGAHHGKAFAIETKRPGAAPTPRQERTIHRMRQGGMVVFVIDGEETELARLDAWLQTNDNGAWLAAETATETIARGV